MLMFACLEFAHSSRIAAITSNLKRVASVQPISIPLV